MQRASRSPEWKTGRWLLTGCLAAVVFGPQPAAFAAGTNSDAPVTYYIQPAAAPTAVPTPSPSPVPPKATDTRAAPAPAAQPVRLAVGQRLQRGADGSLTVIPPGSAGTTSTSAIPHLSSRLNDLLAEQDRGALPQAAQAAGARLEGANLLVTISARTGQGQAVADAVAATGGRVTARYDDVLDAYVPSAGLSSVAGLSAVDAIDLPSIGVPTQFPPVLTEAFPLINASGWRAAQLTGFGVKVGIIDAGFQGYTSLLGTRLPSVVDTSCTQQTLQNGVTHGTAVTEITRDIAPSAQYFLAAVSTSTELGVAERCMAAAGVSVVNMSLAFGYSGPGNGTGVTESVIDDAVSRGIFWSNSAGNYATAHWSGPWADANNNSFIDFVPGGELNQVFLTAGQQITVFLRWDDPWGGSCNDYDLALINPGQTAVVASSVNSQTCTQNPLEAFAYVPPVSGLYGIAISRFMASSTSNFDLLVLSQQQLQYQVAARSISAPADSANAGMVAVGAVAWSNPAALEAFSSQGPSNDGRMKPDLVGPDAVSTVTFGTGAFAGTSASAPHVAGAAADIKAANPGLTPAQIKSFLLSNAVDVGPPGPDNQFGTGRLDLGVPPVACTGRSISDPVAVSVARAGAGQLQVTLTPTSTIRLRSVQFGDASVMPAAPVNALIDILGMVGASGSFAQALPDRPSAVGFTVRKATMGVAATVPLVVTDGCGVWRTFVGAGAAI